MMKRAKGATLPEIMKATGWQPHTVQASTDRTVPSTYRLVISSLKVGRRGNQFKRNAFA
jgi:hypothetical protein